MSEDSEYMKMVNNFKAQFEETWGKSQKGMSDLFNSAKADFDKMQAQYSKGNKSMLESAQKNYDDMKKQLKEKYDKVKGDNEGIVESTVSKFTTGCSDLLGKFSSSTKSAYDEAVTSVSAKKKSTVEEGEAKYNQLVKDMDKNFEETKKKLSSAKDDMKSKK